MIDDEGRLHLWVGEEVVMLTAEEFRENNRKVAEAAWDEGRQSLALDMGNPLREDMTRESTANPHRAKGASNG